MSAASLMMACLGPRAPLSTLCHTCFLPPRRPCLQDISTFITTSFAFYLSPSHSRWTHLSKQDPQLPRNSQIFLFTWITWSTSNVAKIFLRLSLRTEPQPWQLDQNIPWGLDPDLCIFSILLGVSSEQSTLRTSGLEQHLRMWMFNKHLKSAYLSVNSSMNYKTWGSLIFFMLYNILVLYGICFIYYVVLCVSHE